MSFCRSMSPTFNPSRKATICSVCRGTRLPPRAWTVDPFYRRLFEIWFADVVNRKKLDSSWTPDHMRDGHHNALRSKIRGGNHWEHLHGPFSDSAVKYVQVMDDKRKYRKRRRSRVVVPEVEQGEKKRVENENSDKHLEADSIQANVQKKVKYEKASARSPTLKNKKTIRKEQMGYSEEIQQRQMNDPLGWDMKISSDQEDKQPFKESEGLVPNDDIVRSIGELDMPSPKRPQNPETFALEQLAANLEWWIKDLEARQKNNV